VPYPVYGIVKK